MIGEGNPLCLHPININVEEVPNFLKCIAQDWKTTENNHQN
jgi:hypothetical protein